MTLGLTHCGDKFANPLTDHLPCHAGGRTLLAAGFQGTVEPHRAHSLRPSAGHLPPMLKTLTTTAPAQVQLTAKDEEVFLLCNASIDMSHQGIFVVIEHNSPIILSELSNSQVSRC